VIGAEQFVVIATEAADHEVLFALRIATVPISVSRAAHRGIVCRADTS